MSGSEDLEGGFDAYNGNGVIACAVVFAALCTLGLVLRFVSHSLSRTPVSWEDWVMIPAWILTMGLCANVICSVKLGGVGRHEAYNIQNQRHVMKAWGQTLFVTELIYGLLIPLAKTPIFLLYLRLFRIHHWFRITTYVLMAYVWAWGISESIVAIAQCHPVAHQWDKTIPGHCIDQLMYYRWVRVPNAIHDVLMLVVPAPVIWHLQIDRRQKVALTSVFLIGSIGCVASFICMYYFFRMDAFSDKTWASIQLMPWTLAEPGAIFICACIPSLWPLIRRLPIIGTLLGRNNTSNVSRSAEIESKHRHEDAGKWSNQPRSIIGNDDFILLKDVGDRTAGYEVSSCGSRDGLSSTVSGNGIKITRAFSVTRPQ